MLCCTKKLFTWLKNNSKAFPHLINISMNKYPMNPLTPKLLSYQPFWTFTFECRFLLKIECTISRTICFWSNNIHVWASIQQIWWNSISYATIMPRACCHKLWTIFVFCFTRGMIKFVRIQKSKKRSHACSQKITKS
jgi:hypothetical protein